MATLTRPTAQLGWPGRSAQVRDRLVLLVGFLLVHVISLDRAWAGSQGVFDGPDTLNCGLFGDVCLYLRWMNAGLHEGSWPVLSFDWVYPVGALVPMVIPLAASTVTTGYLMAWCALIVFLNAVAIIVAVNYLPNGVLGAWFWLAALLIQMPTWLGRLDGIVAPLILISLSLAIQHPRAAVVVAAIGAWIKVVPVAVGIAIAATRRTIRSVLGQVVAYAGITTAAVVGLAVALGSGGRVLSVFGEHGGRGLQVESVAGSFHSLARLWSEQYYAEYSQQIKTWEIVGPGAPLVATLLDPLMVLAVLAITWLIWRANRSQLSETDSSNITNHENVVDPDSLFVGALALLTALIVFNKVGSPQFMAWLGPPIAAGIGYTAKLRNWLVPAALVLVISGFTRLIFPLYYPEFLDGEAWLVLVGVARNLALLALLGWAGWRLRQLGYTYRTTAPRPLGELR